MIMSVTEEQPSYKIFFLSFFLIFFYFKNDLFLQKDAYFSVSHVSITAA